MAQSHHSGPGKYGVSGPARNTMCGTMPVDHCAANSCSSSVMARRTSRCAQPMAMNALSQLHWCGYRRGAALVQPPASLPCSTAAAWSRSTARVSAVTVTAGLPRPFGAGYQKATNTVAERRVPDQAKPKIMPGERGRLLSPPEQIRGINCSPESREWMPLLHTDAESVLELIEGLDPASLKCLVPEARQGAPDYLVVARAQRDHSLQRVVPVLVAHSLLPWPDTAVFRLWHGPRRWIRAGRPPQPGPSSRLGHRAGDRADDAGPR